MRIRFTVLLLSMLCLSVQCPAQQESEIDGLWQKLSTQPQFELPSSVADQAILRDQQSWTRHLAKWYVQQVKYSLLSPVNHGGWPYRSSLLESYGPTIYKELKSMLNEQQPPEPIVAYALLCPAMAEDDEKTVSQCIIIANSNPYLARILPDQVEHFRKRAKSVYAKRPQ